MPRSRPAPAAPSRATLLVVLLGATLLLAGLLAVEAYRSTRSRQVTAERALRDYATIAAWEFQAGVEDRLDNLLRDAFAPLTGTRAGSPFDRLPPPDLLEHTAGEALRCVRDPDRVYFRLDLRDQTLTVPADSRAGERSAWLGQAVAVHAREVYRPEWRYAVLAGSGLANDRLVVYGVKFAQYGAFAQPGAPIAAYGFSTCRSALGPELFRPVLDGAALLPSPALSGLPNDSLISVSVLDSEGRALFASDSAELSPFIGEVTLRQVGGATVRTALRRGAAERLAVVSTSAVRMPLLLVLIALTGGLAVVAVLQLRREHELARLRSDFTSSVSHELRTPLAQILLYGETLSLGRARTDLERQQAAETIVVEARRLMRLVEDVLHFARVERGVQRLEPRPLRLAPAVAEISVAFRAASGGAPARLETLLDPAARARVDPDALRQIVFNLLENSLKYGPAGERIRLGVSVAGPDVQLWVEDEGPGIAEAERERIWLPFVRTPADHPNGTGIGLAVVRALAEAHGGTATVEPAANGGVRFVVAFPALPPVAEEGTA